MYKDAFRAYVARAASCQTNAIDSRETKNFYVDLCAVLTFLIPRRRPEALVSILTVFYNLGDIGAVAMLFSTKLADNLLTYFLCAHTNFRAQMPACRATGAQAVFTKALYPRRTELSSRV